MNAHQRSPLRLIVLVTILYSAQGWKMPMCPQLRCPRNYRPVQYCEPINHPTTTTRTTTTCAMVTCREGTEYTEEPGRCPYCRPITSTTTTTEMNCVTITCMPGTIYVNPSVGCPYCETTTQTTTGEPVMCTKPICDDDAYICNNGCSCCPP